MKRSYTLLVTYDYNFAQAILYNVVPLVGDSSYVPYAQGCSQSRPKLTFKLPHLHVLRPGSLIRNKVQHSAILQLLCDFTCVKE